MTSYHIMASVLSPVFVRERHTKKQKQTNTVYIPVYIRREFHHHVSSVNEILRICTHCEQIIASSINWLEFTANYFPLN